MKNRHNLYKPSNMTYDLDATNNVVYVSPQNACTPTKVHTKWWSPEQRAEIELILLEDEFLEIYARCPELLVSYKAL